MLDTDYLKRLFARRCASGTVLGLCCLASIFGTACASAGPAEQPVSPKAQISVEDPSAITEAELDDQLRRFSDRFTTRMSVATDLVQEME